MEVYVRNRQNQRGGEGWEGRQVDKEGRQLLQVAESWLVAHVPAGTGEASVLIRTLSHTLYASLATLTMDEA